VYKTDDKYTYIVTTSDIVENFNNYKILYSDNHYKKATLVGHNKSNQLAVLKTEKKENINSVCLANTNHVYKGQLSFAYGSYGQNNSFILKGIINQIGVVYSKEGYVYTFRNMVQIKSSGKIHGTAVFDEIGRLIGMITDHHSKIEGSSYVLETNKLIKIADSIIKCGKYQANYIKYSLEDYSNLNSVLKESFKVSKSAKTGVVITTFKPLKYIFGGLNQGMVIVAVNGVEINNIYELDKQLVRYNKDDNVCLKVIKKNGKVGFYYVKV
jgi:serine protease Do